MILPFSSSIDLTALNESTKSVIAPLLRSAPPCARGEKIAANSLVSFGHLGSKRYLLLTDGELSLVGSEGVLVTYQTGDLVGLHDASLPLLTVRAGDTGATADVYAEADLLACLSKEPELWGAWQEFVCRSMSVVLQALEGRFPSGASATPALQPYKPGERILSQGDRGDRVFTMLEGSAEVEVDGVNVGEVKSGELFGALAAITGARRSASVTAKTHCLVMSVDRTEFGSLLRSHPGLVIKLLEVMARTIQDLNARLVGHAGYM